MISFCSFVLLHSINKRGRKVKTQLHGDNVTGPSPRWCSNDVPCSLCYSTGKMLMLLAIKSRDFISCFKRQLSQISIHFWKKTRQHRASSVLDLPYFQCFGKDKVIISYQQCIYFKKFIFSNQTKKDRGRRGTQHQELKMQCWWC